ncbi:hypothetical protein VE03_04815 [Pseudogymnoascus sp. 23342-1-I1]|nr:hypothetical protein VE03_04815 [Pseudogymnoascus sp. 23342-1-I1]
MDDSDSDSPVVSILFLGDAGCGKSTFFSRISQGAAGQQADRSIAPLRDGDQPFAYDIKFCNRPFRFQLYDTASPENWKLLHPDVVVLCFDISQRLSMIHMQRHVRISFPITIYFSEAIGRKRLTYFQWINETIKTFMQGRELPIIVLGLKRDLRSEEDPNGIIYPQEAYRIAQEMRCDKYIECSAVTGELLREAWEDICKTGAQTTNKVDGLEGLSEGGCLIM